MYRIRKQPLGKVTVFTVKNMMQEARNASGKCAATETKLPQCRRFTMSTLYWFTGLGRYWLVVSSLIQGPCEIRIPGPKHRQQWVQYVYACYLCR